MRKCLLVLSILITINIHAQDRNYLAVNSGLFNYTEEDVFIRQPSKSFDGKHLVSPDPQKWPWEERLENGMPNVLVDDKGNISVYFSSFISYSPTPPSKVGIVAYVNTSGDFTRWRRPDAGLYWYNPNGQTADEKISPIYKDGFQKTNIVAVDIESVGIFDDKTSELPIKMVYMPQREFHHKYLGAYQMERLFTKDAILAGFTNFKKDRLEKQDVLKFRFINADTHMNWMYNGNKYYFTSRVNTKRSYLFPNEKVPFVGGDPRKRYRRSTLTEVGEKITTEDVSFNVILDYSTKKWEPYSMQPFRFPGYEHDVWLGLVTVYGVIGFPETENKQRTELAFSNDGINWRYLKPGIPFLDNGADPSSDDFGCINIATPVYNTILHTQLGPNTPFFFYAASNGRHVEGRNPGLSLAIGKYGKIAGLRTTGTKIFYSSSPLNCSGFQVADLPLFSVKNAFALGSNYAPMILGDITDDPTGKTLLQLNSYVSFRMFAYDPNSTHGMGSYLGGTLGSSIPGTHNVSDEFQSIGFIYQGVDGKSKEAVLRYLKKYSDSHPKEIVSMCNFPPIPTVFETRIKNATLYSVKFPAANDKSVSVDLDNLNKFKFPAVWDYFPPNYLIEKCYVEDFSGITYQPNIAIPTHMERGAIAVKVKPQYEKYDQTLFTLYSNDSNYMNIDYTSDGKFVYMLTKEGTTYLQIEMSPPTGQSFVGKDVTITVEAVNSEDRKYMTSFNEETTVMHLSCPSLKYEKDESQRIIWNYIREEPTPLDSCNARSFAYLPFTAFVSDMNKIIVGGKNEECDNRFTGTFYQIEIADKLPKGADVFWKKKE